MTMMNKIFFFCLYSGLDVWSLEELLGLARKLDAESILSFGTFLQLVLCQRDFIQRIAFLTNLNSALSSLLISGFGEARTFEIETNTMTQSDPRP